MRYFKLIQDGYILSIGTGYDGVAISLDEYNKIMTVIKSRPEADKGFDYLLKEDLTWEMIEVPIIEPPEKELTDADKAAEEALAILAGEVQI